ncbi:conserved oligomeric Golgi complex subunit 1 [Micractinium conductrix]|uniref:Conserved oligomeric Golgi complex subunit 1 n=1 Tax=Micractinium conductrix TaxID=554055 RepID=A0A2P6V911_9CHLO|nr:conserved oligomeric Golgi complex subunit 1 [Micractinium conductrix]|eukprot:PSC70573.1 conserved oligomeric Golgi complex subunit 1 [Micractinium conductrix]
MDVGQLFRERTIAEIREVETRTHHEIEEKKQQLRHVVGDSYRDLISSADTIIDIARSCQRLVELTGGLQGGLGALAAGAAAGGGAPPTPAASSYDRLYALGSRIKYLIDTPETIYGCLDGREFLAAARRFVRAAEVHRVLTAGQAKQVAQRFPLLQHQWPLVKKFRPQVYNAAGTWLGSHGELSAAQAAAALAAQALLKPMDGAEVLKAFLTARQAYIMQCLSGAAAAGADTDLDSLAFILADVATMVCSTLAQCGELFLQLPGVSATPLLVQALAADDSSSVDLLFDTGKEAEAWKAQVDAVRGRLAELSAAGLALECRQWLDQLSQQLRQLGGRLLGPCASGQGLLSVEAAVKAALEEWQYGLQPVTQAGEAADAAVAMSWADICQWVLGRACPLWPLLFEQPLLERAKQLVASDFSSLVDKVAGLLGIALQEAAALPPLTPGSAHAGAWCDTFELQPATPDATVGGRLGGSKRRRLTGHAKAGVAAQRQGSTPQAWLPQAEQVVQRFDQQLSKLLAAALDACGSGAAQQGGSVAADNAASAQQSALGLAETVASRALILQPFVQDRCAEAAEGIAASLGARLLALPAQQAGSDAAAIAGYAPVATQALVLGRVALGMASRSSMLPLVLGSPDRWHAAVHSGSSNGSAGSAGGRPLQGRLPSGVAPAPPAARFERLQQRLHSVGLQAYGSWAAWASEGLADALTAGLASDPTLAANAPLRCWEETVIGGGGGGDGGDLGEDSMDGGGGGGSGLEMRFQLPAAPSPAAVQLALAACQEIDRAGGHLLEEEPLLLLKWRLGGSLLAALTAALAEAGEAAGDGGVLAGKLSEKGVLQVLFDARFLLDLLSGGRPVSAGAADAASSAAAVTSRRHEAAALEARLSGRLDPIDWATYEPYLYSNKDRAAARCQVLFGMLLRGDRPQQRSGAPLPPGAANMPADSNILRMAPVGPRFSYLPVTTPMALLRQSSMQQLSAGGGLGGEALSSSSSASGSEVSAYSFASLLSEGGGRARPSGEGGAGAGGYAAQAGAASSGVGKLVGLLGDRAASALGDMGGSSLLSSFNKGWL